MKYRNEILEFIAAPVECMLNFEQCSFFFFFLLLNCNRCLFLFVEQQQPGCLLSSPRTGEQQILIHGVP